MFYIIALVFIFSVSVTPGTTEPSPSIVPVDGGLNGTGVTTRYWDCCKPSCSWVENIKTESSIPIASCAIDGDTPIGPGELSGCGNGTAYMCTNQQPFVVNSTLAYGYVAASFKGSTDYQLCCGCVLLSFKGDLAGKHLLAQITNAGSDLVANQFDIAIPGGGVGLNNGCTAQWDAPAEGWGDLYGGVHTEAECDQLPEQLQGGCKFRFGFMEGVSNPEVSFEQVYCPKELVAITGCEL